MRIVADIGDCILKVLAFSRGLDAILLIQERSRVTPVTLRNDRDNGLASQITCNEDDVRLIHVHLDGIKKLAIGAVCSMQVGTHVTTKVFSHVLSSSRSLKNLISPVQTAYLRSYKKVYKSFRENTMLRWILFKKK